MIDHMDVRVELEALASQVDDTDQRAAKRLRDLGDAIDGGRYADAWATTNLHDMIETEGIIQRYKLKRKTDLSIMALEIIRNTLIFAPLIVTWYGVSVAVTTYHNLLHDDLNFASQPFLYLWQDGFDHRLQSWQTLGTLAAIDFVILFIVLLTTLAILLLSSVAKDRREQEAEDLKSKLIHTLTRATLCLNTRNWSQPTNIVDRFDNMTKNFDKVVTQLLEQMKQEHIVLSNLAKSQKQNSDAFIAFKTDLFSIMNTVSTSVSEMQASNTKLSTTINELVTPTKQIATQQAKIMASSQDAVVLLRNHVTAQEEVVKQQKLWGTELQRVLTILDTTVKHGENLASSVAGFTTQQADFLKAIKLEREQQVQLANRMYTSSEHLRKTVEQINQCLIEWQAVNVNMDGLIKRIISRYP